MALSKATKPCFYLAVKADVTELMTIRPKLRKRLGAKITTNAFYIRAMALAAADFPLATALLENDQLTIPESANVGFAVDAPHGLVVPVIKQAETKSLADIAREEKKLTEKARDHQLRLEEVSDENLALSNLGPYEIDWFIGIVPPQTSTILATGNPERRIVPAPGKPAVRRILNLTLAVDHRALNGDYAARFLASLVAKLEHPQALL
jgi:pyruvate dehydrogenase E2 component (dihydrolipoamide acetyltransferase)